MAASTVAVLAASGVDNGADPKEGGETSTPNERIARAMKLGKRKVRIEAPADRNLIKRLLHQGAAASVLAATANLAK
jgi:hypothetical protein